ncbi:MAG: TetR/AcrR family transcriptional regulator [Opitutales bacterium]
MKSTEPGTRERLLRETERLFATGGVGAITLREVTDRAGANLAAVNYHFGSKEGLIRTMLQERVEPVNAARIRRLEAARAAHGEAPIPVVTLLEAMMLPVLEEAEREADGEGTFLRMMGRVLSEPASFLREFHEQFFRDIAQRFHAELVRSCPHLDSIDLAYRMHFTVSAFTGALLQRRRLAWMSRGRIDPEDNDGLFHQLLPYLAAGLNAPAAETAQPRKP